jgi:hypothetical protein
MPSRKRLAFLDAVGSLSSFSKKAARTARAARPKSTRIRSLARRVDRAEHHLASLRSSPASPAVVVRRSADRLLAESVAILVALTARSRGKPAKSRKR